MAEVTVVDVVSAVGVVVAVVVLVVPGDVEWLSCCSSLDAESLNAGVGYCNSTIDVVSQ